MLELSIDNTKYTCEGSYNELSRKRIYGLMKMLCTGRITGQKMMEIVLYMLKPKRYSEEMKTLLKTPPEWVHHICQESEILGWIFDENSLLTKYVVRGFWHKGTYYIGPPKRMMRISGLEYVATREAFARWKKTNNEAYLNDVIAILYRPINIFWWLKKWDSTWTGDKRLALNDYTKVKRSKAIATMPAWVKATIAKQYAGGLKEFETKYPLIYKANSGGSAEDGSKWTDLIFVMSGGIFGTLRQTEEADVTELHIKMEADIKQNLKLKDKLKT